MDIVWHANIEVTCLEDPKDKRRLKYYREVYKRKCELQTDQ